MALSLGTLTGTVGGISSFGNISSAASGIGSAVSNLFSGGKQANFPKPIQITLQLGSFVFQDMEVPEVIPFHAAQRLSVKKMIGGTRQIDAMGTDFAPISWSGSIWPSKTLTALQRAKQLEMLRDAGQPLTLSWDLQRYQVYIADFAPDYRFARIPYTLTLEVLEDLTQPVSTVVNPTIDDLAGQGVSDANSLMSLIAKLENLSSSIVSGIGALGGLLSNLTVAVYAASSITSSASSASPAYSGTSSTAVGNTTTSGTTSTIGATSTTLVGAPPSVVNPILQAAVAAINQAALLVSQVDVILAAAPGVGGVVVGQVAAVNVSALIGFMSANQLQIYLLQMKATLNVLLSNLQQINSSVRVITVSGGNLYDIAALEYGDSTAAVLIMEANGLLDPTITGIVTLIIPPYNATTANGGILAV